jgi:hypothetical protein
VSFLAPAIDGGNAIASYVATSVPDGLTGSCAGPAACTITVGNLANGTPYTFTVTASNGVGISLPSTASNSVTPAAVPDAPTDVTAVAGNAQATVNFAAPVSNGGSPILSYTATSSPDGLTGTCVGPAACTITVANLVNGTAYTFTVTAANSAQISLPSAASSSVTPATIPDAPSAVSALSGDRQATVTFTAPASNGGSSIVSYTATSNPGGLTGSCTGPTACTITIANLVNGTPYTFTVTASNGVGISLPSVPSNSVTPIQITRLSNISTRGPSLTGAKVMIGGFVISGSTPKTVLVRARGPSMIALGVTGVLANPVLNLYSGSTVIASNDDWGSADNAAAVSATGLAPSDPNEAAILTTLSPGPYTAIVTGAAGTTGVAIVEVLEIDHPESPLSNISTRGPVQTGNNVMIGGFIITGSTPQTVLIRARGPSMTALGVTGALNDPVLNLYFGATVIATNDNWGSASNAASISATGNAPSDPRESAILMTLNPGPYTAIVTGVGGTTGVAIVEVLAQ